ncbi:MAG: hypothetical protein AAFZ67_07930 [Planctomycetota bacterium]
MKKIKVLLGLGGVLVLLLVIALLAGFLYINQIAKTGVEKGATYALDVPTSLDNADIKLFGGEFGLSGLTVSNPEGYDTPHFLKLGDGAASVDFSTIQQDTVEIPSLVLENIDIYLDKEDGKANYEVILENLKRFESADSGDDADAPPADPDAPKKKYVIRKVEVRNVTAHVEFLPLAGDLARTTVVVPEIILEDVGEKDPVTVAKLTNVLIKAIFASVINVGSDVLPAGLVDGLNAGLGGLTDLASAGIGMGINVGEGMVNVVGDVGGMAAGAVEDAAGAVGDAADEIGEGVGDAVRGVGGLIGLGGNDDKEEQEPALEDEPDSDSDGGG